MVRWSVRVCASSRPAGGLRRGRRPSPEGGFWCGEAKRAEAAYVRFLPGAERNKGCSAALQ